MPNTRSPGRDFYSGEEVVGFSPSFAGTPVPRSAMAGRSDSDYLRNALMSAVHVKAKQQPDPTYDWSDRDPRNLPEPQLQVIHKSPAPRMRSYKASAGKSKRNGKAVTRRTPAVSKEEILRLLACSPRVIDLYDEQARFWGRQLEFIAASKAEFSHYEVNVGTDSEALAKVFLKTGTRRVHCDLCHELLHLKLYTSGFPMWFTGGVRVQSAGGSPAFIGAKYRSFLNALDHLTFIEDFVALGLPEEEVVARNSTRIEATLLLLEDLWKKPEFLAFHRIVRNLLYATEFMSDTLIRNFIRSSLLEEHIVKRFDEAREDTQVVRKWVRQRTWMIGRNRKDALYTLWTMVGIPTLDEAFLVKLPAGIYFR